MVYSHVTLTNRFSVSSSINITFSEVFIHYAYTYSSQLSGDTWFAIGSYFFNGHRHAVPIFLNAT